MLNDLTILPKPIGIRSEQICTEPTTLRLQQHSSLLSPGGYTITDATDQTTRFSASGKTKKWFSNRTITDSAGLPLYELRCDKLSRWTIATPGQQDDDAEARFFRKRTPNGDTLTLSFRNSETGEDVALAIRGKTSLIKAGEQCVSSKDSSVYLDDRLVVQTRILDGKKARVPFKTNEWDVHVAQGFDESLVSLNYTARLDNAARAIH